MIRTTDTSKRLIPLLLATTLMVGCAGWRPLRDVPPPESPATYANATQEGDALEAKWWMEFGDTTLNRLMDEAFRENLTLRQQLARVEQVRAQYVSVRSSWFPTISASGSESEADYLGAGGGFNLAELQSGVTPIFLPQTYSVSASAAYELDLFGKLHAQRQAAKADLIASQEDLRAFALTLSAQVARSWYSVVALREQRALLLQTVEAYQENLTLIEERYQRGVAQSLDLYQARQSLSGALSQYELNAINLAAAEHALSVLMGRYPERMSESHPFTLPQQIELPPPGLPSELVTRRPDLRAAHARLVAADRRAAEAVANRFPSFSLTGTFSGRSNDLAEVFNPDRMVWQAVTGITLPLFEGGRRKAGSDAAQAALEGQVALWQQTVFNAFKEVEDALVRGDHQRKVISHLENQVEASKLSLDLATERYLRGVTDYLPVIVQQSSYFNARLNLINARQGLVDARIQLAIVLGGGWTDEQLKLAFPSEKGESAEDKQ